MMAEVGSSSVSRVSTAPRPKLMVMALFTFCISTKELPAFSIRTYDEYSALMKNDYMIWEEKMRCKNEHDKICSYILWSNIVSGIGNFDKEAIVMSKSGMARLWSWDNTFNALDLADKDFELSFNQFIYPYRYMDSHGRTPDCIASTCITRAFVKAPVQGWIYKQLVTKNKKYADTDIIYKIYFHMKKNTEWWLNFRGETPCYYHGNDSGSDNSTCFDKNEIIESPDLIAFLSVQCDVLSQMAEKLNMYTDIRIYKHLSDELLQKCLTYFENGEIFVRDGVSKEIYRTQSLMPFRMIVLENKLPQEIKQYIITKLENDFLCPFGLASEAKNSPEYCPDSYWRGPAWAPDQIICSLALKNMGENELSEKISQNYKSALEKSGFSENHDAITGEGLRCNAYTWAANAYRIL